MEPLPTMSLDEKVLNVCEILRTLPQVLTPKQFVTQFLQSNNSDIAYLRRYWAQPRGIESSMELARSLRNELARTETGREAWQLFIKEEVSIGFTLAQHFIPCVINLSSSGSGTGVPDPGSSIATSWQLPRGTVPQLHHSGREVLHF
ncbi:hypothetical protein MJO29_007274 [Puccinia striiformis f. sp. tritici]|nr:hypothetical protein MJO29_007274 [Puccinia striiformis f. sp. tritici]